MVSTLGYKRQQLQMRVALSLTLFFKSLFSKTTITTKQPPFPRVVLSITTINKPLTRRTACAIRILIIYPKDSLQEFETDSNPETNSTIININTNISSSSSSTTLAAAAGAASALSPSSSSSSSPSSTLSRYENQKRKDWNTFGQYLRNHRPPLSSSAIPTHRHPVPSLYAKLAGAWTNSGRLRFTPSSVPSSGSQPTGTLSLPSMRRLGEPRRPHLRPPRCF
ncbi:hypothetical protein FEM48_Zijuj07G0060400 [Ziziphus jujuba var. spinosa]|uniref:ALOG domain-containing protein n=1 Tax=Ziziphus jujuba var. spinosa TaxID=714518 RepID=A0A978V2W5_ZIZJJ|nr:hypothetical protein FEM48_Zijuj07G0060400 [Ziziphus jujuba var. spinosa]